MAPRPGKLGRGFLLLLTAGTVRGEASPALTEHEYSTNRACQ